MKKLICVALLLICCFSSFNVSAATTMYAPDGRTVNVHSWEVSSWESVGWYRYPVITMYAPDGRTAVVYSYDATSWENVGWYREPVTTMYAPDGRTTIVYRYNVAAWAAMGWYTAPVMTMYAPDGRSIVIYKSDYAAWAAVGWYSYNAPAVYTPPVTVNLSDLDELSKKNIVSLQTSGQKTNTGSVIYDALRPSVSYYDNVEIIDFVKNGAYIEYYVGCQYKALEGTLAVSTGFSNTNCKLKVQILGDEKVIYTSPILAYNTAPVDFYVDVNPYTYLKVKFVTVSGENWGWNADNFAVGDAILYK